MLLMLSVMIDSRHQPGCPMPLGPPTNPSFAKELFMTFDTTSTKVPFLVLLSIYSSGHQFVKEFTLFYSRTLDLLRDL